MPSAVPISLSHQGGGGAGDNAAPLVRALMLRLGEILSVWGKPTATAVLDKNKGVVGRGKQGVLGMCPPGNVSKEARATGEEAFALAGAHIGLLRALPTKDGWYGPLSDCLREVGVVQVLAPVRICARPWRTPLVYRFFFCKVRSCVGLQAVHAQSIYPLFGESRL